MSFFLFAIAAAAAASAGYIAARRRRPVATTAREEDDDDEAAKKAAPKKPAAPKKDSASKSASKKVAPPKKLSPYDGLPLALGDVVSADREERWLAGAVIARDEERVVGVVFMAPEGAEQHAVAVFAPPRLDIFMLAPAAVDCPSEPPTTLELGGLALTRTSRLPVLLAREGQGAPDLPESGTLATYEAGGRDVAVVICAGGRAHAWLGRRYDEGEYDRMGAGGSE